jgi:uncharacterized damage-inducible protein DinB
MNGSEAAAIVRAEQKLLGNLLVAFNNEHGDFRPTPEMMSTAQQINHIAQTIHWFREGAFGSGFDLDFEKLEAVNKADLTLEDALADLDRQYASLIAFLETQSEADLQAPMPENPIFGNAPRCVVLHAQADHTAHHRGALSVYLRLLGIKPPMIYQG